MNVGIVGGAGYIGSKLAHILLGFRECDGQQAFNVRVIDNLMYGQTSLLACAPFSNFEFVRGDAADKKHLRSMVEWADVVVPLAAIVGAPACDANVHEAQRVNEDAIHALLAVVHDGVHIIYPNTNSGYGATARETPCTEHTVMKPVSHYGTTKMRGEEAVLKHAKSTVFRLATVFGVSPRMRWDLMVNDFVRRARNDRHIVIFEGTARRNFVAVRDVCAAFVWALRNPERSMGVFNLGNDDLNMTKDGLAAHIAVSFPDCTVISEEFHYDVDQRDYIVSSQKLRAAGFAAKATITDAIPELEKALDMWPTGEGYNV